MTCFSSEASATDDLRLPSVPDLVKVAYTCSLHGSTEARLLAFHANTRVPHHSLNCLLKDVYVCKVAEVLQQKCVVEHTPCFSNILSMLYCIGLIHQLHCFLDLLNAILRPVERLLNIWSKKPVLWFFPPVLQLQYFSELTVLWEDAPIRHVRGGNYCCQPHQRQTHWICVC